MSETVTLFLPKLGESIHSAKIVTWLKQVGDRVERDEALLEVATDKVNSEIPSPEAGILTEILAPIESEIEVGAPLARLSRVGKATSAESPRAPQEQLKSTPTASAPASKDALFSPAVLRLAELEGVPVETLRTLPATGEGGRLTKRDLENYLVKRLAAPPSHKPLCASKTPACPPSSQSTPTGAASHLEERILMTGMRKAIAENMVRSFYEAPHASLVMEADVTEVMRLIAREKEAFLAAHGYKLTVTTFLVQALTKAIMHYPMLNASLEGETIVMKRYVNIGLAVHVDGGLLVPVVKHCEERTLVSLAKDIADLSHRARHKRLSPDEVKEGTITLTNFGMTGALIGVPIIRYPEVAIIGAGAIQKRVVVRDDDSLAVRQMLYITLTFDHRIIDGIYGCEFLAALKHNLESVEYQ